MIGVQSSTLDMAAGKIRYRYDLKIRPGWSRLSCSPSPRPDHVLSLRMSQGREVPPGLPPSVQPVAGTALSDACGARWLRVALLIDYGSRPCRRGKTWSCNVMLDFC